MTFDDLYDEQRVLAKQRILESWNERHGEGTSYDELSMADDLVSDKYARDWYAGTDFVEEDFA